MHSCVLTYIVGASQPKENNDASGGDRMRSARVIHRLGVTALGCGLALHYLAVYLRDHGPVSDHWSLRGNGAAIVLPMALLLLVAGEWIGLRKRAWLAVPVVPIALFLGLFVFAGSF
jgi:hypothetical protein